MIAQKIRKLSFIATDVRAIGKLIPRESRVTGAHRKYLMEAPELGKKVFLPEKPV